MQDKVIIKTKKSIILVLLISVNLRVRYIDRVNKNKYKTSTLINESIACNGMYAITKSIIELLNTKDLLILNNIKRNILIVNELKIKFKSPSIKL